MAKSNNKTGKGGYNKGKSGNPRGRPKVVKEVRALAKSHTEQAVNVLVEIMNSTGAREAARVAAANAILDRGWGRPAQELELVGKNGAPLKSVLNVTFLTE
jgi:hypothetical protein